MGEKDGKEKILSRIEMYIQKGGAKHESRKSDFEMQMTSFKSQAFKSQAFKSAPCQSLHRYT